MRKLKHNAIVAYHRFQDKRRKPRVVYLYFGGRRPFQIGDILTSDGNMKKVISYGTMKIVGVYKDTKLKSFVMKRKWLKVFLEGLGFKFRLYDYKCVSI